MCGGAAPLGAETLREALAAAYSANPRLDAERARLRATDEDVARAMSGYRPTIAGTAEVGRQRTETNPGLATDGSSNPKSVGLTVAQPLFRGFRTVNAVSEAEANVRAGRETLRQVEQSVLLETVTAYLDVVRDDRLIAVREANVAILEKLFQATLERVRLGEITRTDATQAEARLAAAVSGLESARGNAKSSRAAYQKVVGHEPRRLTQPASVERGLPRALAEAKAVAVEESPQVAAAIYREQAARFNVDKIWGELLPTVSLEGARTQRYDTNPRVDEQEVTTISGRVSVPIYGAGDVHARVRQAKHTQASRRQEVQQARDEATAATVQAWSQLAAAKAQLVADRTQVRAARATTNGVRREQEVGQRSLLDVLNAEQEALVGDVQVVSTERNVVVASYALLAAIGRLNVEAVEAGAAAYDPEENWRQTRRRWWRLTITHADGREETHDFWQSVGRRHQHD